jgi:hypothetical protein
MVIAHKYVIAVKAMIPEAPEAIAAPWPGAQI